MAAAKPGWYEYGNEGGYAWWDGHNWVLDQPRTEDEQTRGVVVYQISPGYFPSLAVHEHEIWMFQFGGKPIGGLIAGSRAEVQTQQQIVASVTSKKWSLTPVLNVRGPKFEFSFPLSTQQSKNAAELAKLNQIAAFVNNRSLKTTPDPTPASTSAPSIADELTKLATLRDQGILTDDEFQAQKAKLLG
jgi:hypothetical protein